MAACRLQDALGLSLVAKSDLTTGCTACTSFVLQSNAATVVITAPGSSAGPAKTGACPLPGYDADAAFDFVKVHGLAVRTIGARPSPLPPPNCACMHDMNPPRLGRQTHASVQAWYAALACLNSNLATTDTGKRRGPAEPQQLDAGIAVTDATAAHAAAMAHGAISVLPPTTVQDTPSGTAAVVAEIRVDPDGDHVLRLVSGDFAGPFLPGFQAPEADAEAARPAGPAAALGVRRVDHIGLSASNERRVIDYLSRTTGAPPARSRLFD